MTYQAASGQVEALAGISASIGAGEFVSLVGPSGCGKSTLLRIVAGLRPATTGTIAVAGRTVTQPIPDIGMVFQAPILLKWRSILENVLLPAELAGKDPRSLRSRAEQLLDMAGLGGFGAKLPRELSGGMQRRAANVGGTLEIESTPGQGTRVFLRLPCPDPGFRPLPVEAAQAPSSEVSSRPAP